MQSLWKTTYPLWLHIFYLLCTGCHCSQYDPHLYPAKGPFFEGWYVRLVDTAQSVSLGFLFGRVLPDSSSTAFDCTKSSLHSSGKHDQCSDILKKSRQKPLVIASVLVQDQRISPELKAFNGAFPVADYSVTVNGRPVVHNPDDASPPDFSIKFGSNGSVVVTAKQAVIDVSIDNVRLFIEAVNPVPWGPHGEGPEGWIEHLPLPLHWFVYSLHSTVTRYKFTHLDSGRTVSGSNAHLHMEKNWGKSFPSAWIWSQGITERNIVLSLSGGIVDFKVLNVTAFLAGYRNPDKKIAWNFTPANSIASFYHNGCDGVVYLNLTGLVHRLALEIVSPLAFFSDCLLGPEKDGFQPVCVESYRAVAHVRAFKRDVFSFVQVDEVYIHEAALEFGGQFVCKDKCSHS